MTEISLNKSYEWQHKRQPSTFVEDELPIMAEVPTIRVTSGPVYDALMKLRAVLREPEKHPEVIIIYARNS